MPTTPSALDVVQIVLGLLRTIERCRAEEGATPQELLALRTANEKVTSALSVAQSANGSQSEHSVLQRAQSAISIAAFWTSGNVGCKNALSAAGKTLLALVPASATPNIDEYLSYRRDMLLAGISEPAITIEGVEGWAVRATCENPNRGTALVRVSEGTCTLFSDLFLRMFAHRHSFETIGDPSKEEVTEPTLNDFYHNLEELVTVGSCNAEPFAWCLPKCPIRFRHAHYLMTIALDFLIQHELTHILHGHAGLRRDRGLAGLTRTQRWALEFDADMTSAVVCLRRISDLARRQTSLPQQVVASSTDDEAIRDVTIAVHTCFLLWQDAIRSRTEGENHPNPRERQRAVMAALNTHCLRTLGEARGPQILNAVASCEAGYRNVTGRECDLESLKDVLLDHGHLLRSFYDGWSAVRDDIQPHAYIRLPPAGPVD